MADSMMDPRIEDLLSKTKTKFGLVTVASQRAREINSYFGHLSDGLGTLVPPQVTSLARKPLSIAFEELAANKIVPVEGTPATPGAAITVDAADLGNSELPGREADKSDD